jgi:hypothetical protein
MKKLIIAGLLLSVTYAYACRIETLVINGKIINCTICGSVTNCS